MSTGDGRGSWVLHFLPTSTDEFFCLSWTLCLSCRDSNTLTAESSLKPLSWQRQYEPNVAQNHTDPDLSGSAGFSGSHETETSCYWGHISVCSHRLLFGSQKISSCLCNSSSWLLSILKCVSRTLVFWYQTTRYTQFPASVESSDLHLYSVEGVDSKVWFEAVVYNIWIYEVIISTLTSTLRHLPSNEAVPESPKCSVTW